MWAKLASLSVVAMLGSGCGSDNEAEDASIIFDLAVADLSTTTPAPCPIGLKLCPAGDGGADRCTNLDTDRDHCGACGVACADGNICVEGACALSCPDTLATCGSGDDAVCTSLASDPLHCGNCGHACPAAIHSACVDGACAPCADGSCRLAFVTSSLHDGALGGLAGADARCQALADAAGLRGVFRAWLSSSLVSASARLTHAPVPYLRVDGELIARDWTDLTSNAIRAFIDRSEIGSIVTSPTPVWTATAADGAIASEASVDGGAATGACADWTSASPSDSGRTGILDDLDDEWSAAFTRSCDTEGALYCLQQ